MIQLFAHEVTYRGEDAIARLGAVRIVVCGAGALGSNLAENLLRQGVRRLRVVDFDRVEAQNIGSQVYDEGDVGALKVEALRARCFRATGAEIEIVARRMTAQNGARIVSGAALVVDAFDNTASRLVVTELCRALPLPCVHLGLHAEYGEVRWNDHYHVPNDAAIPDACAYPLARNLVLLLVALGSEVVVRYLLEGCTEGYTVTLRDLKVQVDDV